jgi:hypothetical protein
MLVLSAFIPLEAVAPPAAAASLLLPLPFLRETSSFSPPTVTADTSGAGSPLALNALSSASSRPGPLYDVLPLLLLLLLPALAVSLLAAARSLSTASWLGSVIVAVVPACKQ